MAITTARLDRHSKGPWPDTAENLKVFVEKTGLPSPPVRSNVLADRSMNKEKCVLIVDETMPLGAIANTVAVLSVSLGKMRPEIVGDSLIDCEGYTHQGITTLAIPILRGSGPLLKRLRNQAKGSEPDLLIVDLISATKFTKSYEVYADVLRRGPADTIEYIGLSLFGDKTTVSALTGSLGLLR